jgi:hypothetical protein
MDCPDTKKMHSIIERMSDLAGLLWSGRIDEAEYRKLLDQMRKDPLWPQFTKAGQSGGHEFLEQSSNSTPFLWRGGREVFENELTKLWRCPNCKWWRQWEDERCTCGVSREIHPVMRRDDFSNTGSLIYQTCSRRPIKTRTIMHKNRELFLLSVRVLTRCVDGPRPSRRDVVALRKNAEPGEVDLPVEELCCALMMRELKRPRRPLAC